MTFCKLQNLCLFITFSSFVHISLHKLYILTQVLRGVVVITGFDKFISLLGDRSYEECMEEVRKEEQ